MVALLVTAGGVEYQANSSTTGTVSPLGGYYTSVVAVTVTLLAGDTVQVREWQGAGSAVVTARLTMVRLAPSA